jgi:formylglycine-generating enzyme required for sulfatase activity
MKKLIFLSFFIAISTHAQHRVPVRGGNVIDEAKSISANPKKQSALLPRVEDKVPFPIKIKTATLDEQIKSLRMAIEDIGNTFPERYDAKAYLRELAGVVTLTDTGTKTDALQRLNRRALLANPALDFDDILLVRRHLGKDRARTTMGRGLGFVAGNSFSMQNAQRNSKGNEIAVLHDFKTDATYETVYKPKADRIISDMDLHFDGKKILFSSVNEQNAFRLFEVGIDGSGFRQVTPDSSGDDVDHFDACYLPDGDILFTSTATFLGMPCIDGRPRMSSLYRYSPATGKIRQISFDQDSSWCPTMMNDGRVLYLRWEYSDLPHSNSRILMTMNPDGTNQKSYLFSNSYFPAAFFYARPIPGDPGTVVGIASGHHGYARTGRMLLVDPRIGEHEADGVVQEIPGYGKKVEADVRDRLVDGIWPHLVHPFPLAEEQTHKGAGKYFLVSMKPSPEALWGIYLVDIFDNRTRLYEMEEYALFEPIPLKASPVPPGKPSLVDESRKTATVFIQDIHAGPGLKGIPRGTVKALRIGSYEFSPSYCKPNAPTQGSGGLNGTIGHDGPWDIKRILGTVPVFEDGSVHFTIPAATPIFIQPLDTHGQALQLMRSWFVGQPGERVSCVGCHESSRDAPLPHQTLAAASPPARIDPWEGGMRNFDYATEIQPIIDRNCMMCHDGQPANGRYQTVRPDYQTQPIPYLGPELIDDWLFRYAGTLNKNNGGGQFSKGYIELFRMTRGPGIESDLHLLTPKEFSADSTEFVQMLRKGHHGVKLTPQEWLKIHEWIDLNTPYHGNRSRIVKGYANEAAALKGMQRSTELAREYGGAEKPFDLSKPRAAERKTAQKKPDVARVQRRRKAGAHPFAAEVTEDIKEPLVLDLGNGQHIKLVYIPSGRFIMGSVGGEMDELPMHPQRIEKGFWMAEAEISNAQLRCFDPQHTSRHEDRIGYQFGRTCYDVNGDELPAVRLSWKTAQAFCDWLCEKTRRKVRLPTEIQWEWACRAGTETPFWFGEADADFAAYANLADKRTEEFAEDTAKGKYKYFEVVRIENPSRYEAYIPAVKSIDDGTFLQQPAKGYTPNPWGLYDMHGNVAEWTRSIYQPYPLNREVDTGRRVVRGGSWRDRPYRATSSYRLAYPEFQQVYNVGFRVIIEE